MIQTDLRLAVNFNLLRSSRENYVGHGEHGGYPPQAPQHLYLPYVPVNKVSIAQSGYSKLGQVRLYYELLIGTITELRQPQKSFTAYCSPAR